MERKQEAEILITHYQNLIALSEKQLRNLEDLQLERLADIMSQKQMIMDVIDKTTRQGAGFSVLGDEVQVEIKNLLYIIKNLEDAIHQRMLETKNRIGTEMVHVRQENNFNKKYNQHVQMPELFDESL
jgi:hypothetical protein